MTQLGEEILKFHERVEVPKANNDSDGSKGQPGAAKQVASGKFQRMLSVLQLEC